MNPLKFAKQKGTSYAEILNAKVETTIIEINNKQVKELSQGEMAQYAARVLYNGAWGIAYSARPEFKLLVDSAIRNAKAIKQNIKIKEVVPTRILVDAKYVDDPRDIDLEDKKARLLALDSRGNHKISTLTFNYADRISENHI